MVRYPIDSSISTYHLNNASSVTEFLQDNYDVIANAQIIYIVDFDIKRRKYENHY